MSQIVGKTIEDALARQGFASTGIVTHWPEIVGAEIADHAEPMRMVWPRRVHEDDPEPATLVLRVEGPVALEIQHLSGVILEKVNRFFGWRAVGAHPDPPGAVEARGPEGQPAPAPDPAVVAAARRRHDRHRGRRAARRAGAAWRLGQANVSAIPWAAGRHIAIIGHSGYRTPPNLASFEGNSLCASPAANSSSPPAALIAAAALLGWAPLARRAGPVLEELMRPGPLPDIVLGKADAPVTIIEYASMTCPHCATFNKTTYPALKTKYIDTGKVRFIFREFPLDELAVAASMLARCAGRTARRRWR